MVSRIVYGEEWAVSQNLVVECGDDSGGAWQKQVGQLRHRDSKDMHMHAAHARLKTFTCHDQV
jgi:hypothetical protein